MESKTKNKQSEEIINKMLQEAFPNTSIVQIKELKEGFFNVAYNITLSNEKEVILKIAPPNDVEVMSYEIDLMRTEVESMQLVRRNTKVPVPEIYYYDDTHSICNADYFIMEKLHGITYNTIRNNISPDEQYEYDFQIGQYNKILNSLSNDTFGIYSTKNLHAKDWSLVFQSMMDSIIKDAIKVQSNFGFSYDTIYRVVEKHSDSLKEVKQPSLVHWDMWEGNIFITDKNISGIIDFERAMWADPLLEYHFRHHTDNPGFYAGYGEYPDDESAKIRRKLYDIYLYTILVTECDYRHYSDDWQLNWAKGLLKEIVEKLK